MKIQSYTTMRGVYVLAAVLFMAAGAAPVLVSRPVSALGQFTNRTISLNSSQLGNNSTDANGTAGTFGEGFNGLKTKHVVSFKISSAAIVNSVAITYCTTPFVETPCVSPSGMSTTLTSATITNGFNTTTGVQMTLDTGTVANSGYFNFGGSNPCGGSSPFRANCILLKRATTQSTTNETANATITLGFGTSASNYITNPTTAGTYYARIYTFSDNAYSTAVDEGTAAFAIPNNDIDITTKVQEQLTFSVGITPTAPSTNCAALTGGGSLNIGDTNGALSTSTPYDGHSYWRVYTNANNGTAIQYSGDTLKSTSGYAITSAGTSGTTTVANGTDMFGLGIDSGDAAANGYSLSTLNRFPTSAAPDVYGGANNANINLAKIALDTTSVTSPKNMVTQGTAQPIACETGSVRYIASASTTTKPGIYRTSIVYIATPTF